MTEIPADVMETANEIAEPWSRIDTDQYEGDFASDLAAVIARAIMAERERCAEKAMSAPIFEQDKKMFGADINAHYETQRRTRELVSLLILRSG